jgi:hypothetical protein
MTVLVGQLARWLNLLLIAQQKWLYSDICIASAFSRRFVIIGVNIVQ